MHGAIGGRPVATRAFCTCQYTGPVFCLCVKPPAGARRAAGCDLCLLHLSKHRARVLDSSLKKHAAHVMFAIGLPTMARLSELARPGHVARSREVTEMTRDASGRLAVPAFFAPFRPLSVVRIAIFRPWAPRLGRDRPRARAPSGGDERKRATAKSAERARWCARPTRRLRGAPAGTGPRRGVSVQSTERHAGSAMHRRY